MDRQHDTGRHKSVPLCKRAHVLLAVIAFHTRVGPPRARAFTRARSHHKVFQAEKTTLPGRVDSVSGFVRVATNVCSARARILTCFPFGRRDCVHRARTRHSHTPFQYAFQLCLRIASLKTQYASLETLPHFGPQSSHLSICYYIQDLH